MDPNTPEKPSRREALKKAGKTAAFIAPVILSFNVNEVKARVSFLPPPPPFR
ncbi:MAG: hypothetical protein ACYC9O_14650 [Candidatus Latescibacterota bacterium]